MAQRASHTLLWARLASPAPPAAEECLFAVELLVQAYRDGDRSAEQTLPDILSLSEPARAQVPEETLAKRRGSRALRERPREEGAAHQARGEHLMLEAACEAGCHARSGGTRRDRGSLQSNAKAKPIFDPLKKGQSRDPQTSTCLKESLCGR